MWLRFLHSMNNLRLQLLQAATSSFTSFKTINQILACIWHPFWLQEPMVSRFRKDSCMLLYCLSLQNIPETPGQGWEGRHPYCLTLYMLRAPLWVKGEATPFFCSILGLPMESWHLSAQALDQPTIGVSWQHDLCAWKNNGPWRS